MSLPNFVKIPNLFFSSTWCPVLILWEMIEWYIDLYRIDFSTEEIMWSYFCIAAHLSGF